MKHTTAYNHRQRAVRAICDLWQRAEHFGLTSRKQRAELSAIMKSVAKCPGWVTSYLVGYDEAMAHVILRKHFFFYTLPDGRLASTHHDRPDYYEKLGLGPKDVYDQAVASGHYWVCENADGTERIRPWFVLAKEGGCVNG